MTEEIKIWTNGGGYTVIKDLETGEMVYLHRLSAIAKYGLDSLAGDTEIHHRICKMIDIPDGVAPIDPMAHRVAHGNGDPTGYPEDVFGDDATCDE